MKECSDINKEATKMKKYWSKVEETIVTFYNLTREELNDVLKKYEGADGYSAHIDILREEDVDDECGCYIVEITSSVGRRKYYDSLSSFFNIELEDLKKLEE